MKGTKTGGRKSGTPNRLTREIRETLKGVIDYELSRLGETLEGLPPEKRLELIVKLPPLACPLAAFFALSLPCLPAELFLRLRNVYVLRR